MLTNRLLPQLWSDPRWRERPDMSMGPDSAREHMKTLLSSLTNVIQSMQADQLLPDGMFLDSREDGTDEQTVIDLTKYDIEDEILGELLLKAPEENIIIAKLVSRLVRNDYLTSTTTESN